MDIMTDYRMSKAFFRLIPKIFCISFISDTKRRKEISPLFKNLGIEDRIEYVYGKPDGGYKCSCKVTYDHASIYKDCIKNSVPFVCIFEDDARIVRDITADDFVSLLTFIKNSSKWNVLLMGYDESTYSIGEQVTKSIVKFKGMHSHAYLISLAGMKAFIEKFRKQLHPVHIGVIDTFFIIDDNTYAYKNPIFIQDIFKNKRQTKRIESFPLIYTANYIYWNRLEYIVLVFIVLIISILKAR